MVKKDGKSPQVIVDGKVYNELMKAVNDISELSDKKYAYEFALIANFILTGLNFEVIEDVDRFRANYKRLLQSDEELAKYGEFDTREIALPRVEGNHIIFFVEERMTALPFKVEGSFPFRDKSGAYSYTKLPYMK